MPLGHDVCAEHCCCLKLLENDYVYDPFRCVTCVTYIRENFQGATVIDHIRSAGSELEVHIKKLRRFLADLEPPCHLKFLKVTEELRKKVKAKVLDLDFFRDLMIGETDEVLEEDQVSIPPSQASGPKSPRSGKPHSPSKTIIEDVASLKGQMARMENALLKLIDLSATTANPTAQTVEITAGSSRHGAEVEEARTLEPLRGTNGSRQGTPEPEQGTQGSGDRGTRDVDIEEVGHEDRGSDAAEAEEDLDDEESILLSNPPCPSCEETLSEISKQSKDPETEYYDFAKERPLSILKCD